MFSSRNFIRFVHKVDIYDKIAVSNDMGQEKALWNISYQDLPCFYTRAGSSTAIRIAPTTDESDYYLMYFNHNAPIDYGTRLKDVRTKVDNEMIQCSWIQVIQIDREMSFGGKVQYLQVKVKSVIE